MEKTLAVILGAGPVGRMMGKLYQAKGIAARFVTRSGRAVEGFETRAADIRDAAALIKAAEGATILVHAAGVLYQDWATEFPLMQDAVLSAASSLGAVAVFAENLYSYTGDTMPLNERSSENPPTKKGQLRLKLSRQWLEAVASGSVQAVSVRASDYFGPGATDSPNSHFGARFFPGLLAGKPVAFLGNPDARHSFTYLPDYARALVDVSLDSKSWGRAWVCPSLEPSTARSVAGLFASAAGKAVKVGKLPGAMVKLLGLFNPMIKEVAEMLYQFEKDFTVDASAFERHFGWKATDLKVAVESTWASHSASRR